MPATVVTARRGGRANVELEEQEADSDHAGSHRRRCQGDAPERPRELDQADADGAARQPTLRGWQEVFAIA